MKRKVPVPPKRKVTFDMYPFAISGDGKEWIVAFSLYGVEFATQPINDREEAMEIARRVRDRIPVWSTGLTHAWVEEEEEVLEK